MSLSSVNLRLVICRTPFAIVPVKPFKCIYNDLLPEYVIKAFDIMKNSIQKITAFLFCACA